VRAYLGHVRLDTPEQVAALNALYDDMWLYYNFFQPVLHLVAKTVDPTSPTRLRRRWDAARTPFDRLCTTNTLASDRLAELAALRARTNPRALRHQLYAGIDQVLALRRPVVAPVVGPANDRHEHHEWEHDAA
jgi:hypothetical protein